MSIRRNVLGALIPLLVALVVLAASVPMAHADIVTYVTPSGSTDSVGDPVNASATFTTASGTVTINLTNLQANIHDAGQLLSDLYFVLSPAATTGTLASSSGQEITVASDHTFTTGSTVSTGWLLTNDGGGFELDGLTGAANTPAHTIIGPPGSDGKYSNANPSIAGNGSHNPFLTYGSATFVVDVTGVNADTRVTSATFSFGTTVGDDVPGTPGTVPEPMSIALFGGVLILTARAIRRRFV